MGRIFTFSRWMVIMPVIGSFVAGISILVLSTIRLIQVLVDTIMVAEISSKVLKSLVLGMLEVIDIYLLGIVFYLISMGLYELFFDENVALPGWLEINSLDDLKSKLVSAVILVILVQFLGLVLSGPGDSSLLSPGAAIAVVIFAATYFISQNIQKKGKGKEEAK